jgi:hypothetical protein
MWWVRCHGGFGYALSGMPKHERLDENDATFLLLRFSQFMDLQRSVKKLNATKRRLTIFTRTVAFWLLQEQKSTDTIADTAWLSRFGFRS